jgi:pimeloyl-ACP methyl ester carboxylesterase
VSGRRRERRRGRALLLGAVAGVAAGLAARWLRCPTIDRTDRPAAHPPAPPEGRRVAVEGPDGVRLHAEVHGPTRGPTIVLTHGWLCSGGIWRAQVAGLAGEHRVVTWDLPGHGRSGPPASGVYDLDLLGDALWALVEAVADGQVVLAGHSLGGMTVLNALARHVALRERTVGVVLASTTSHARVTRRLPGPDIGTLARAERSVQRVSEPLRRLDVDLAVPRALTRALVRWAGVGPGADPAIVEIAVAEVLASDPDVLLGLAPAIARVDEDAGLDALGPDGIPALVLVGTHDRLTPWALSRRMARRSGARLVEIPGVGHFTPLEAAVPLTRAIAAAAAGTLADAPVVD